MTEKTSPTSPEPIQPLGTELTGPITPRSAERVFRDVIVLLESGRLFWCSRMYTLEPRPSTRYDDGMALRYASSIPIAKVQLSSRTLDTTCRC